MDATVCVVGLYIAENGETAGYSTTYAGRGRPEKNIPDVRNISAVNFLHFDLFCNFFYK